MLILYAHLNLYYMSLLCKLILNEYLIHGMNYRSSLNNKDLKCLYGTGPTSPGP